MCNYKLEYKVLTGSNGGAFTAFINATRAGCFINFMEHFREELGRLFEGVKIYENEEDILSNRGKELSISYKQLQVEVLSKVYEEVYEYRKKELKFLFEEKEVEYKELSEIDRLRYGLLFRYGEKLGGYIGVMQLSIEELVRVNKVFLGIEEKIREKKREKKREKR